MHGQSRSGGGSSNFGCEFRRPASEACREGPGLEHTRRWRRQHAWQASTSEMVRHHLEGGVRRGLGVQASCCDGVLGRRRPATLLLDVQQAGRRRRRSQLGRWRLRARANGGMRRCVRRHALGAVTSRRAPSGDTPVASFHGRQGSARARRHRRRRVVSRAPLRVINCHRAAANPSSLPSFASCIAGTARVARARVTERQRWRGPRGR